MGRAVGPREGRAVGPREGRALVALTVAAMARAVASACEVPVSQEMWEELLPFLQEEQVGPPPPPWCRWAGRRSA